MRHLLLVALMFVGCTGPQHLKPTISPSEECHMVLEAFCAHSAFCDEGISNTSTLEQYEQCIDFLSGEVPFNGHGIDWRGRCDQVTYTNNNVPKCILDLVDDVSCEWPTSCDNVVIVSQ